VYQEYIEAVKSSHTDDIRKRPVFKRTIDDALVGKYDVLVVHKIDRFSRKLRITLEYFEKLGKAGIGFVSIGNCDSYPQMGTMPRNMKERLSRNFGKMRPRWDSRPHAISFFRFRDEAVSQLTGLLFMDRRGIYPLQQDQCYKQKDGSYYPYYPVVIGQGCDDCPHNE